MITPGKYMAVAIEGALREGKKAPYVAVKFGLTESRDTIWANFSMSNTSMGKSGKTVAEVSIKALLACGWDGSDLAALVGLGSKEVELAIGTEEYQGETRMRVKYVNIPGDPSDYEKPLPPSEAQALNKEMRGAINKAQKALGVAETQGPDDSDLPF